MKYPKTITVDGMKFTRSGRDYYYNSWNRIYLHRYLWEKKNGKIPDGFELHHIDKNALNNSLENLQILTIDEHKKLHADELTEDRREWFRNNLNENARPKAIEWHKSEEGKMWHKEHYEKTKDKLHVYSNFVCECCGKEFEAKDVKTNKFCSNSCKSKWRRDNGLDDVVRICRNCGNEFVINKYRKTVSCSKSCAMKAQYRLKDSPNIQE